MYRLTDFELSFADWLCLPIWLSCFGVLNRPENGATAILQDVFSVTGLRWTRTIARNENSQIITPASWEEWMHCYSWALLLWGGKSGSFKELTSYTTRKKYLQLEEDFVNFHCATWSNTKEMSGHLLQRFICQLNCSSSGLLATFKTSSDIFQTAPRFSFIKYIILCNEEQAPSGQNTRAEKKKKK